MKSEKATEKLSLLSAVLINLNIMIGAGIFINTVILTKTSGALGALVYPLVGLLVLPLILSFSRLLATIPSGTFYDIGSTLQPAWGFISSWSYFVGKLATAALGIHVCVTLLQMLSPHLAQLNTLVIDSLVITLFVCLNMLNIKTGRSINYAFIILKFIPITFVVLTACIFFSTDHFTSESLIWRGIPACVPFVVFAFAGFEASCSLSKSIKNSQKNGPRAIIISYCITMITVIAYQLGFFGVLGSYLGTLQSFHASIPALINATLPANLSLGLFLKIISLIGIATSSLGASYGVIYSNIWNLHILAEKKHIFFARYFSKKNSSGIPALCVIAAGIIALMYLFLFWENQVPLQQIAAFGVTITYTISVVSLLLLQKASSSDKIIAALGLASCALFIYATGLNAFHFGFDSLFMYLALVVAGIIMFFVTTPRSCPLKKRA